MEQADKIIKLILTIFSALAGYQIILPIIGFFFKSRKFKETNKINNYAVLIAARNEEKVITQLIKSIRQQTYPQDKITIFLCVGNSTDNTKQVALDAGAIVYEEPPAPLKKRNKGRALKFVLDCIARDYEATGGIQTFDGYFTFDADTILDKNYITEMNKAFEYKEYDYFTNYACAKNFDDNVVSSYGGMGLYYNANTNYRPLSLLRLTTRIRGSANLIRSNLLKDGWKWAYNCEDAGFSASQVANGVRGTYVEAAKIYEEQPNTMKMLIRQRMRWDRGRVTIFFRKIGSLIEGIFMNRGIIRRVSCYDAAIFLFPYGVLTLVASFLYPLGVAIYNLASPGNTYSWLSMLQWVGIYYGILYAQIFGTYLLTIIREHKNICCPIKKLWWRLFVWPFMGIFFSYVQIVAIFKPVRWKSITRTDFRTIDDISAQKTLFEKTEESKEQEQK